MRFDILTIFPDFFDSPLAAGMIRRAWQGQIIDVRVHNIRDFTANKHAMTDDRPFGGGAGMVMKPEPLAAAVRHARVDSAGGKVVLLSPQGRTLDQRLATELAGEQHLILVCGRYEGVDERFRSAYVDREVSIGDYVLTGGEPAALVLLDCVIRLLPGVLGCDESAANDTFSPGSRGGLKYPQYTRPRVFEGQKAPEVLFSGDHAVIAQWRFLAAVRRTVERRPELLNTATFTPAELKLLARHDLLNKSEMA
ncbi:MAG: tRNA (guanosine(37)-N1)-methyltransferase TrmD [Desulfobulbaceae bacterium]|nr:MAG: tRNA (guanosine(37)-N1)-methyltransferase TrmD [Desulfobulbaceae bacterium]